MNYWPGAGGCDFSGLEQGSLGRPLEQLGQEFTAAEVPSERGWIVLTARWVEGGGAQGGSVCAIHTTPQA